MTSKQIILNIRAYKAYLFTFRSTGSYNYLYEAAQIWKVTNRELSKMGIKLPKLHRNKVRELL